tara:strand:- start:307 stop:570 length:264 start_codon:yes stop_codon:yes gene_type:complete
MAFSANYVMVMVLFGVQFEKAFAGLCRYAIDYPSVFECLEIPIDSDKIEGAWAKHFMEFLGGKGFGLINKQLEQRFSGLRYPQSLLF